MITTSKIKYLKTSWRKAGLLLDLIRGKSADKAIGLLTFTNKAVSPEILKAVKSGVNNLKESSDKVFIKEAFVNQGTTMKRVRPGARGSAMLIRKKTCSVTLKLELIG